MPVSYASTTACTQSPQAKFAEYPAHVRLHGARRHVEPPGDLGVGHSPRHQREYLVLAGGEGGQDVRGGPGVRAERRRRQVQEPLDEPPGCGGCDHGVAGHHDPHGGRQVRGEGVLEQKPLAPARRPA
jgi:hypothetical protein